MRKIEGLIITPLKEFSTPGGAVLQGLKDSDVGYFGIGEVYFSINKYKSVKDWKRHKRMTMNIVVPTGSIRFVIYDDRLDSDTRNMFFDITLSRRSYKRLTVPPGLWMATQGLEETENLLVNIASISHSPDEIDRKPVAEIPFNW